jgi:signal transduction histidine kinase
MIQEIINNALKYAESKTMNLDIIQSNEILTIKFDDKGKGFDQKTIETKGLGLKNIESRVLLLSGKYKPESKPGFGTKYWIEIPIQENKN